MVRELTAARRGLCHRQVMCVLQAVMWPARWRCALRARGSAILEIVAGARGKRWAGPYPQNVSDVNRKFVWLCFFVNCDGDDEYSLVSFPQLHTDGDGAHGHDWRTWETLTPHVRGTTGTAVPRGRGRCMLPVLLYFSSANNKGN